MLTKLVQNGMKDTNISHDCWKDIVIWNGATIIDICKKATYFPKRLSQLSIFLNF